MPSAKCLHSQYHARPRLLISTLIISFFGVCARQFLLFLFMYTTYITLPVHLRILRCNWELGEAAATYNQPSHFPNDTNKQTKEEEKNCMHELLCSVHTFFHLIVKIDLSLTNAYSWALKSSSFAESFVRKLVPRVENEFCQLKVGGSLCIWNFSSVQSLTSCMAKTTIHSRSQCGWRGFWFLEWKTFQLRS